MGMQSCTGSIKEHLFEDVKPSGREHYLLVESLILDTWFKQTLSLFLLLQIPAIIEAFCTKK